MSTRPPFPRSKKLWALRVWVLTVKVNFKPKSVRDRKKIITEGWYHFWWSRGGCIFCWKKQLWFSQLGRRYKNIILLKALMISSLVFPPNTHTQNSSTWIYKYWIYQYFHGIDPPRCKNILDNKLFKSQQDTQPNPDRAGCFIFPFVLSEILEKLWSRCLPRCLTRFFSMLWKGRKFPLKRWGQWCVRCWIFHIKCFIHNFVVSIP